MTPDTQHDEDLDRLEQLLETGIPGPWEAIYDNSTSDVSIRIEGEDPSFYTEVCSTSQWPDDQDRSATADLIVALRNDVPALLAELRSLRRAIRSGVLPQETAERAGERLLGQAE